MERLKDALKSNKEVVIYCKTYDDVLECLNLLQYELPHLRWRSGSPLHKHTPLRNTKYLFIKNDKYQRLVLTQSDVYCLSQAKNLIYFNFKKLSMSDVLMPNKKELLSFLG